MRKLARWLLRSVVVVILLAGAFVVHVWYFTPYRIDWFYSRAFAQFALQSPQLLSDLRILPPWLDFYSDELDDASPAHEARMAEMFKAALQTLHRYDRTALDREARLSYDTLDYFLSMHVESDRFRVHDYPINQMYAVQSSLPNFMAQTHQVTDRHEADAYVSRLARFPQVFAGVIDGLKLRESLGIIPPEFTVTEVLDQMRGFIGTPASENILYTSFQEKLDRIPRDAMDTQTREALLDRVDTAIDSSVYPAYRGLIAHLAALQPKAKGNFGAWHLPQGDAYYAWCVRSHTTTDMTPAQVHDLGLAEVTRLSAEMDAILRKRGLTEGTIGARVQQLAHDPAATFPNTPAGKAAMLKRYQEILDEVDKGLDGAFDVRPTLGVEVRAVPRFAEKTADLAYYEAGSFDGTRPGVFYANMRDTTGQPKWAMRSLAYHEGIPGHHFQISIAQQLQGLPFFRRLVPFTAYTEGWALYAERLAWELGFEQDPLDDLGRLRDEMVRAARLVVDSGIHSKRWTREQAIQYMMDNTGRNESDVTAEVEGYFVDPGQALAYTVGMLKILELRERAKQALGPKFSLSEFHDQVLTHGALPLTLLERVIDDWIRSKQAA